MTVLLTRLGDLCLTRDTHFVCNSAVNLFKMALETLNHQSIQGCQIASFGQKGNRPWLVSESAHSAGISCRLSPY